MMSVSENFFLEAVVVFFIRYDLICHLYLVNCDVNFFYLYEEFLKT